MQYTLALLALAASVVSAQGVTGVLTPTASAPAGCSTNYAGNFEITVVLPPKTSKRSEESLLEKRQSTVCASDGTLVASLKNGILTDAKGRIGEIVANHQFQFDGPPAQAGSIYTGGWAVCNNGSLAIGGQAYFYQCLSGTFYNLYDTPAGAQCQLVLIDIIPCSSGSGSTAAGAGQATDGQATAASATAVVTQKTDGQPNAASATKVASQISDGQVQASSAVYKPVSQFTDGQIQVTATPAPPPAVTQIGDGQVQASKATTAALKPVSQISDGQVQATKATTAAPPPAVTQITDGQVQASKATSAPAAAPTPATPVTQIGDGQIQASNATKTASTAVFTGAAPTMNSGAQLIAGAAAAVAFAML